MEPSIFQQCLVRLREVGYNQAIAIEPVHQDYMNTLFEDVITEVIALRDCFKNWSS